MNTNQIREIFQRTHKDNHSAQLFIKKADQEIMLNSGEFGDDSLVNVYSISKAFVTLALYDICADANVSIDRPVSDFWAAFSSGAKKEITIAHILNHRAGMACFGELISTEDMYDWDKVVGVLERTEPLHRPGRKYCYHARTYGFLLGEIVRRISGVKLGAYFRDEICKNFDAEFHFGLQNDSEFSRLIPLTTVDQLDPDEHDLSNGTVLNDDTVIDNALLVYTKRVFENPSNHILAPNDPNWCRAEIPSSGGISSAINIVSLFSRYMQAETKGAELIRSNLATTAETEHDYVLGFPVQWKRGFGGNQGEFGQGHNRYGFRAIGGSIFFFDLTEQLYFCYTTTKMLTQVGRHPAHDPRVVELFDKT